MIPQLESSRQDGSNEVSQQMLLWTNEMHYHRISIKNSPFWGPGIQSNNQPCSYKEGHVKFLSIFGKQQKFTCSNYISIEYCSADQL